MACPPDIREWIQQAGVNKTLPLNFEAAVADGILVAEVIHSKYPKLVELHNYVPAHSKEQKVSNWNTLNARVFPKLRCPLSSEDIEAFAERRSNGKIFEYLRVLKFKMAAYEPLYQSEVLASRDRRMQQQKDKQRVRRASTLLTAVPELQDANIPDDASIASRARRSTADSSQVEAGRRHLGERATVRFSDERSVVSEDSFVSRASTTRSGTSRSSLSSGKRKVKVPKSAKRMDEMYEKLTSQLNHTLETARRSSDLMEHQSSIFDKQIEAIRRKNKEDLKKTEQTLVKLRLSQRPETSAIANPISPLTTEETVLEERNDRLDALIEEAKAEVYPLGKNLSDDESDSDESSGSLSSSHLDDQESPSEEHAKHSSFVAEFANSVASAFQRDFTTLDRHLSFASEHSESGSDEDEEDIPPPPPVPPPASLLAQAHSDPNSEDASTQPVTAQEVQHWRQVFDEQHQTYYYENLITGDSTWDAPEDGIISCRDDSCGQDYFMVASTGASFWSFDEALNALHHTSKAEAHSEYENLGPEVQQTQAPSDYLSGDQSGAAVAASILKEEFGYDQYAENQSGLDSGPFLAGDEVGEVSESERQVSLLSFGEQFDAVPAVPGISSQYEHEGHGESVVDKTAEDINQLVEVQEEIVEVESFEQTGYENLQGSTVEHDQRSWEWDGSQEALAEYDDPPRPPPPTQLPPSPPAPRI